MNFEGDENKAARNLSKHRVSFEEAKTVGSRRKSFGRTTVRLEPDVAEIFPNAEAVNEALRFLIKVMQENQAFAPKMQPSTSLERQDERS